MHPISTIHVRELVVNWHVTEVCNYGCHYCYAKWDDDGQQRELIHDTAATAALVDEVGQFFNSGNHCNPLRQAMQWDALRLNLAGGEPLLYADRVLCIIEHARRLGLGASIITNGSRLTPSLMATLAPHLAVLGLSVDAANDTINLAIGRADRKQTTLPVRELTTLLKAARQHYPAMQLKMNTVVNALNWDADMAGLISELAPDKWKILRMLPQVTSALAVTDAQFDAFVHRHAGLDLQMRVEDHADMTESYIMIDPLGRFFQNAAGATGYLYSEPILKVGAAQAFAQLNMSAAKFHSRYVDLPGTAA